MLNTNIDLIWRKKITAIKVNAMVIYTKVHESDFMTENSISALSFEDRNIVFNNLLRVRKEIVEMTNEMNDLSNNIAAWAAKKNQDEKKA